MKCSFCGHYVESDGSFCPYCGKVLKTDTVDPPATHPVTAAMPAPYATTSEWAEPKEPTGLGLWARYFAHGILFSLLIIMGSVVWAIVMIPLVLCGAFIGLIIALLLLVLLFGFINALLCDWIWNLSMDYKGTSVFLHGFVIILILIAASIPSMLVQAVVPNLLVSIMLFIVYCFVDGVVGRWVGKMWSKGARRPISYRY
jgi:hypothetical protein